MNKIVLGVYALLGYVYKFLIDLGALKIPELFCSCNDDIIVSITSYGRRVETNVVYYTLVSILRQTRQPKRIILCLDKTKWSESTLPPKILSLKNKGVDFLFCDDVRSYTKLVPALQKYNKSIIITLDDDIIYSRHTIENLFSAHEAYPKDICCFQALHMICTDGVPSQYRKWKEIKPPFRGKGSVFPLGVGGVLYPPDSLHHDVVRSDLFLNLCPQADDIWFWFCGLRNKTNICVVEKQGRDISFDSLYQYFNKGTALTHSNRFENQNDMQFAEVMKYYGLVVRDDALQTL